MNFRKPYSLLIVIFTIFLPLDIHAASQENVVTFDQQIAQVKDIYSLYDGWNLSFRAPSSLSSENAHLLSQVNNRWNKYRAVTSYGTKPKISGISLTAGYLEDILKEYGSAASKRIKSWQKVSQLAHGLSARAKLVQVNTFFNRLAFKSDRQNWDKNDYWASPVEFLIRNAGDCEDYAIAKYFTLKAMGVEIDRLRITYVKSETRGQAHMVLAYYDDKEQDPLILDNLNSKILPATKRPDLTPIFSFNG